MPASKIDVAKIEELFAACDQHGLALAQPSLYDQYLSHDIVKTRQEEGSLVRFTNFVEVQAPVFHGRALDILAPTILDERVKCGWGLDYAWPHLLRRGIERGELPASEPHDIGIVDQVAVLHTKAPGAGWAAKPGGRGDAFYAKQSINPEEEMEATLRQYGLSNRNKPRPCEDFKRRISRKTSEVLFS